MLNAHGPQRKIKQHGSADNRTIKGDVREEADGMCTCTCPYPLCQAVSERPIASKSSWRRRVVAPLPICFTIIIYLFSPNAMWSGTSGNCVFKCCCCWSCLLLLFPPMPAGETKKSSEYFGGGGKGRRKTAKCQRGKCLCCTCTAVVHDPQQL